MEVRILEADSVRWLGIVLGGVAVFGCSETPNGQDPEPMAGLTEEELSAEPPWPLPDPTSGPVGPPVDVEDATDVRIDALAEVGYVDEWGRYVIDLLEQDYAYLGVRLETQDGRPVRGATPVFSMDGTSQLLEPAEVSSQATTDDFGEVKFAVVGGQMGLDRVRVEFGEASVEILVNVISLEAAGFPKPPVVEGGIPWADLMKARVRYEDNMLFADLPEAIAARDGETVKLSGFMMPLDPDLTQRRFLLTSNPPSCFFHVPGGPAGAVEVFADEGIEMSWDPVVVEGRFEPQEQSDIGVVYRLHDARLVVL